MTLMTVFVGIIAFCSLVLLLAVAFLAMSMKKLLDSSVTPVLEDVKSTVDSVNKLVETVDGKVDRILGVGEDTVRKVSGRVVATSEVMQDTITTPLITLSSAVAGIAKAIETWRRDSGKS
jgi:hypothetical protein